MAVGYSTFRRREKLCARRKLALIKRSRTFAGRKVFIGTTSAGARWSGKIRLLRRCADHDRSRRSLSRLRITMDRNLGRTDFRARQRFWPISAPAPSWSSTEQRDVAPPRGGAWRTFHARDRRSAGLWLVGNAAVASRPCAIHQARYGAGHGGGDGGDRFCALPPCRTRPRRPRRLPARARSSRPTRAA